MLASKFCQEIYWHYLLTLIIALILMDIVIQVWGHRTNSQILQLPIV